MCKNLMCVISVTAVLALASASQAVVIGNWENDMDGWVLGGGATDARYSDVNGVTLGKYSLDLFVPKSDWQEALKIDLNKANFVQAFASSQKVSIDVTRLAADWPAQPAPGWGGLHMAINAGGDGWSIWQEFGYQGNWVPSNGDQTQTVVWDYSQHLSKMNFNSVWWCELLFVTNYDPQYPGPVTLYLDNCQLFGGGRAVGPKPGSGAVDVSTNVTFAWEAGTYAKSHNVYLGTDSAKVDAANLAGDPNVLFASVNATSFKPVPLQFNTRYYWRVDEVNDTNPNSPWKGPVWSFTTANFIVVEDFESYTDNSEGGQAIFQTWLDGWADAASGGSQVGYTNAPFAERTLVHTGSQAMPLDYNNVDASFSEAVRTWAEPQNWTLNNYDTMKIYVQGKATNVADQLYVTVEDSAGKAATVKCADTKIMTTEAWTEWLIPVSQFTDVNMAAVTKLTIGVGNPDSPSGAKGLLLIDDIQVAPKPMGLVAYYAFENNADDGSGNGFNGVLVGDPNRPVTYVAGPAGFGKGILFNGAGGHQYVDLGTFNPSTATGKLSVALWAKWNGLSPSWQGMIGKRHGEWTASGMMWQIEANQVNGSVHFQREGANDLQLATSLTTGEWTHLAVTFDGVTATGYVNGAQVATTTFSFGFDQQAPLQIGSSTEDGGNPFNGAIDEIRLYDGVLTAAEIKALAGK